MTGIVVDILCNLVLPFALALLVAALCTRLLPGDAAARWRFVAGAAAGIALGYVLLPEWAPLAPERHWQWLPYLAIAGAILGAIASGDRVLSWERALVSALLSAVAALAIVPFWESLQPPRPISVPLLGCYFYLLITLTAAVPQRLQGRTFTALLTLSAVTTTLVVAIEVSLKFGHLGAVLFSSLAGVAACGLFFPMRSTEASDASLSIALSNRSLVALYGVAIGGLAFVGAIEKTPAATPLLILPAAPLVLWLFAFGPLGRLQGASAIALKVLAVLLVTAAAILWLIFSTPAESDDWSSQPMNSATAIAQLRQAQPHR
jgi:hypothetical protein